MRIETGVPPKHTFFSGEPCRDALIASMKTPAFPLAAIKLLLAAVFLLPHTGTRAADAAADSATAYRALRVARAALGAEALGRLVEVTGHDGVPQPYVWKIVLKEGASGSKEVDVADGKIIAQRTLPRAPEVSGLVKLQTLNLDSSGAFAAADAQSRKVRVRFDSINYTLRADATGQPIWTMDLFNLDGASVGTMRLTATDGTIASIDGRLAEGPGRPGEPLTAASAAVAPAHTVSTTTTVQATTAPPPAPPSAALPPPPAVHDVETAPPPAAVDESGAGGFFTRAGRTLDHTQDKVAHSIDTAHDNVARSIDETNAKVQHSIRATGAKLDRFFTGHDPEN
jgi:hypothetical protein